MSHACRGAIACENMVRLGRRLGHASVVNGQKMSTRQTCSIGCNDTFFLHGMEALSRTKELLRGLHDIMQRRRDALRGEPAPHSPVVALGKTDSSLAAGMVDIFLGGLERDVLGSLDRTSKVLDCISMNM